MQSSEYLSITPEALATYMELAQKLPSQSPAPQRWLHRGYVLWKAGDAIFKRPHREPLLDFLVDHLKYTFGKKWANGQYALPLEKRHAVMRQWFSLCELQTASAPPDHKPGQLYRIEPTGDAVEFMSLADDLYRLRLVNALRPKMVKRLRNHAEFQGARYECAIDASFVRSGFDIAWQTGAGKKCEFVATHKLTRELIAIEVKSRRRPGTLNQPGRAPDRSRLRLDVKHLYEQAIGQCPADKACGIFIDVNLPPESAADQTRIPWWDDIKAMLSQYPEPGPTTPGTETCLVFTSFGWHYTGKDKAQGQRHVFVFPQYVRRRLEHQDTFVALLRSIDTYGEIPVFE